MAAARFHRYSPLWPETPSSHVWVFTQDGWLRATRPCTIGLLLSSPSRLKSPSRLALSMALDESAATATLAFPFPTFGSHDILSCGRRSPRFPVFHIRTS